MESKEKTQFSGILVCCVGFFFIFAAYISVQGRATNIFKDLGFQNLGTYMIGVIYIGFGISTFVSPSIVIALKYRWSLVISSSSYTALAFVCMIPAARDKYGETTGIFSEPSIYTLCCFFSFLLGFFASVIWTAQGSYFTVLSNPKQLGFTMSLIWVFFSAAYIFGSLFTALTYSGAFQFFLYMGCISLVSNIVLCFIPKPKEQRSHQESDSSRHLNKQEIEVKSGPKKVNCKAVCKLAFSKEMLLFSPLLFHSGFIIITIAVVISSTSASFAKDYDGKTESEANRLSSYLLLTVGISEFCISFIIGQLLDRSSGRTNLIIYVVNGVASYMIVIGACLTHSFTWVWFLASVITGFFESYTNTMINAFFGRQFKAQKQEAFSLFKGIQALGAAVGGFIIPFFLKNQWRQGLLGFYLVLFVLASIAVFFTKSGRRKAKVQQPHQEAVK